MKTSQLNLCHTQTMHQVGDRDGIPRRRFTGIHGWPSAKDRHKREQITVYHATRWNIMLHSPPTILLYQSLGAKQERCKRERPRFSKFEAMWLQDQGFRRSQLVHNFSWTRSRAQLWNKHVFGTINKQLKSAPEEKRTQSIHKPKEVLNEQKMVPRQSDEVLNKRNSINRIKNGTRQWVYEEEEIKRVMVTYFEDILLSSSPTKPKGGDECDECESYGTNE